MDVSDCAWLCFGPAVELSRVCGPEMSTVPTSPRHLFLQKVSCLDSGWNGFPIICLKKEKTVEYWRLVSSRDSSHRQTAANDSIGLVSLKMPGAPAPNHTGVPALASEPPFPSQTTRVEVWAASLGKHLLGLKEWALTAPLQSPWKCGPHTSSSSLPWKVSGFISDPQSQTLPEESPAMGVSTSVLVSGSCEGREPSLMESHRTEGPPFSALPKALSPEPWTWL